MTEEITTTDVQTAEDTTASSADIKQPKLEKDVYVYAVGRRKTASAQVRMYHDKETSAVINGKEMSEYFDTEALRAIVLDPINKLDDGQGWRITVVVKGGGKHAQAEAVRHGVARALVEHHAPFRPVLKQSGFLKRDPRKKERKKPGLKKARKAAQWSKR